MKQRLPCSSGSRHCSLSLFCHHSAGGLPRTSEVFPHVERRGDKLDEEAGGAGEAGAGA